MTSTAKDYAELDAAILKAIAGGASDFTAVEGSQAVRAIATRHSVSSARNRYGDCKPAFRFIDARLQALRKSGALKFDRKNGWQVVGSAQ